MWFEKEDAMLTPDEYLTMKCVENLESIVDPYQNTVFAKARNLSSKKKGSFFEKLTEEYFVKKFKVISEKPKSKDHDFILNKYKIENKGSTLWCNNKGVPLYFKWQQIRIAQDYDFMVFLAMYPDKVRFFYASKQDLINNLDPYKNNQHGGKKVNSGTMEIIGHPEKFPWLKEVKDASFITR